MNLQHLAWGVVVLVIGVPCGVSGNPPPPPSPPPFRLAVSTSNQTTATGETRAPTAVSAGVGTLLLTGTRASAAVDYLPNKSIMPCFLGADCGSPRDVPPPTTTRAWSVRGQLLEYAQNVPSYLERVMSSSQRNLSFSVTRIQNLCRSHAWGVPWRHPNHQSVPLDYQFSGQLLRKGRIS